MITSTSNPRVKWVRALQAKRRARQEEAAFVIEGLRLAREVVTAQTPVHLVLHTEHLDGRARGVVNNLARLGAEVLAVSDAVMSACSDTETPSGILAVVAQPSTSVPEKLTLAVIADRISDPGNMGTLLRTSLAAGVEAVFLTAGTVDPYNPKVVRGAMGAQLRLPILPLDFNQPPQQLSDVQIWLSEAAAGKPHYEVDWRQPVALLIGGEAQGPQPASRAHADGQVHIPMPGAIESLNVAVAASVILFEIIRQRGSYEDPRTDRIS
jgi:TrmH family RNA methyltransferase